MNPRRLFAALAILISAATLAPAAPALKPNIVFIFADDQGIHDVGCYGSEIKTPNIDSLAQRGLKFTQFYVASPVCTPSRFSLLTGRYPNRSHDHLLGALMFLDPRDDHRGIRADETTIAQILHSRGYRTAVIGKWHLGHGEPQFFPEQHGFDFSYGCMGGCVDYFTHCYANKPDWYRSDQPLEQTGYATDLITDEAVHYLTQQKSGQPFFLYLPFTAPHYGKAVDPKTGKAVNVLQAKPADLARVAGLKGNHEYAASIVSMDDGIGRILQTLREQHLEENTLVIFASDNGGDPNYGGNNQPFRGGKFNLFEGGIREPFIAVWPGHIPAGAVTAQPAIATDIYPTFCTLTGDPTNSAVLDGVDLTPVLLHQKTFSRDLFWALPHATAFRQGDWKYLRTEKETFLFNLAADPAETKNLAAQNPEKVRDLAAAAQAIKQIFH